MTYAPSVMKIQRPIDTSSGIVENVEMESSIAMDWAEFRHHYTISADWHPAGVDRSASHKLHLYNN